MRNIRLAAILLLSATGMAACTTTPDPQIVRVTTYPEKSYTIETRNGGCTLVTKYIPAVRAFRDGRIESYTISTAASLECNL